MKTPTFSRIFAWTLACSLVLVLSSCNNDDDQPGPPPASNTPILATTELSSITLTSAMSGGTITDDRGSTVIARGVCWSTSPNPTTADSTTTDGLGAGSFSSSITGLEPNTSYFVRAYATSAQGTGYGSTFSFQTLDETHFIDQRDGNIYRSVVIGNQVWMAENLKFLPSVNPSNSGLTLNPRFFVYGYDGNNVQEAKMSDMYVTYGVLYNWSAAMNGESESFTNPSNVQGICPDGWHLPSRSEWEQLADYLGGSGVAGGKLKESGTEHWLFPNTGANNESDFTGLPGGIGGFPTGSAQLGTEGWWWSATRWSFDDAYYFRLQSTEEYSDLFFTGLGLGFCVRCVKN